MTALALLVSLATYLGQSQVDKLPQFDVASIRLANLNTDDDSSSDRVDISLGGRLTMRSIRLNSCVKWAYGVQDAQIVDRVGLTAGLISERYDIVAQAAGPTSDKNLKLMMQSLLADRFKLVLHREKKELAIYKLVVAKSGPKFRKSEGEGNREIRRSRVGVVAEKISMSEFADYLSGEVHGPVQDMTGLTGSFNLALDLRPYVANASTPVMISSLILEAMRDQLGLQLQSQRGLTDILVIDHVERPTAN
jgi:uncharacterized protein (TIGR03435 family)